MILFRLRFSSGLFLAVLFLLTLLAAPSAQARATRKKTSSRISYTTGTTTVLRGRASWYGREFQGRRTTSGERYNRFKFTCAHRTLPFGTRLRVTNPETGKAVVVRVTDRGPFRHQRILDLAEVAARPLDIVRLGAIGVIAEVVPASTPLGLTDAPENLEALQAADPAPDAAFATYSLPEPQPDATAHTDSVAAAARAAMAAIDAMPAPAITPLTAVSMTYLVQAGTFADPANAQAMLAKIAALDDNLEVNLAEETINGRVLSRVLVGTYPSRSEAEAVRKRLLLYGVGGLVRGVPAGS